ncbi:MAG: hypothetical protein J6U05_03110 [Neisseriaceae bacterium]|nr:hypothetical protein [Neisseriaceae bacterium]
MAIKKQNDYSKLNIFRQPERVDFLTPHGFEIAHAISLKHNLWEWR